MPVPTPRTPICVARGNKSDLNANIAAIQEGEICYAFDEDALYVKEGGTLVKAGGAGSLTGVTGVTPIRVSNANPQVPQVSVDPATTVAYGTVRWADAAHIAAGTPGHAVDAFHLKQFLPNGQQLLDLLQWNGTSWVADRRLDGGNF